MVHRMQSPPPPLNPSRKNHVTVNIKAEVNDFSDGFHSSPFKRPKLNSSMQESNPLEEPGPLGLKLKKSPSFLDLIQMKLSQEKSTPLGKTLAKKEKEKGGSGTVNGVDKLKASNFPAALLKIGTWEYKSRYEGDLVAKCYFAKHKLVWEVLDGGLKNKVEIQWSDIMAIKANYPDNAPGTLDVVLARQPLFFREINPQPRKHTLWQATSDFTCGQATVHRRHFLQFPQGTLGKHFEKLMQCDPRLRFLSQQPEIVLENPYFQPVVSIFGDDHGLGFQLKTERGTTIPGYGDAVTTSGLSSSDMENHDSSQRNPSTLPGMFVMEGDVTSKLNQTYGLNLLNQIKVPGLHPSMSVGDLVNHIGECISEQMRSDNPNLSIGEGQKRNILDEITQYLLNDTPSPSVSDERHIMSRVDSLCCLLQRDHTVIQSSQVRSNNTVDPTVAHTQDQFNSNERQGMTMSRKDSVDELLLHLPRIASLPQFLVNVQED